MNAPSGVTIHMDEITDAGLEALADLLIDAVEAEQANAHELAMTAGEPGPRRRRERSAAEPATVRLRA